MNIFVLHEDPRIAAQMQCNRHATKMIVEQAQMLCFAHQVATKDKRWVARNIKFKFNKGHAKHPCTLWLMEHPENYAWAYRFLQEMLIEYDYRYDGLRRGKYATIVKMMPKLARIAGTDLTVDQVKADPPHFICAMSKSPECYSEYAVDSYRRYYIAAKQGFADWKRRGAPAWYESGLRQFARHGDIQRVRV